MHSNMTSKLIGASKSLRTVRPCACMWLLSSVGPHVSFQMVGTGESPLADFTFKGAYTSVFTAMPSQLITSGEPLSTAFNFTGIRFLSSVLSNVHLKMRQLHVSLGTTWVQANKRFATLFLLGNNVGHAWNPRYHHVLVNHGWRVVRWELHWMHVTGLIHGWHRGYDTHLRLVVGEGGKERVDVHHCLLRRGWWGERLRWVGVGVSDDVHVAALIEWSVAAVATHWEGLVHHRDRRVLDWSSRGVLLGSTRRGVDELVIRSGRTLVERYGVGRWWRVHLLLQTVVGHFGASILDRRDGTVHVTDVLHWRIAD